MTASEPLDQTTAHQPTQPLSGEMQKARSKLSLRSLLIVPFVLQIFAAVGIVVEKHGGRLEVNSTLCQGSELAISIPVN